MYFNVISPLKDWKVDMWFSFDFVFLIYRISTFPERFKYKVIEFLQPYFKQDAYLLFDCLYDNNAECIDTFTLFQYLQKNNIKSYYLINKNNKTFDKIKKITNLKNVIIMKPPQKFPLIIYYYILITHTIVASFGYDYSLKLERLIYKNRKINYIFCNHGMSFMKLFPVKYYYDSNRFNYFIVSNEFEEKMLIENTHWSDKNLIKTGFLRLDSLKKENNTDKNIFIMFTWRKYLTDIDFVQSNYFYALDSLLNNEELVKYAQNNNIKIKISFHHELIRRINLTDNIIFKNKNIEIVEMTNISEQISKTSLFITDFSSIAFDFMYLDIPVIFYRFDTDLKEHIKEEESINYAISKDKYLYNCCYTEEDTVKTIIKYIQNGFVLEDENKEKNKQFFTYVQKNSVCKNLVEIINNLNKDK